MADTKTCTKCGETYPATAEYFQKNRDRPDGLRSDCKACSREYRQQNAERRRECRREYYQQNTASAREYAREYHQQNAEHIRARMRDYNQQNAEHIREYKREYNQQNAEHIREYRQQNSERRREYAREYHQRPKAKSGNIIRSHNRRARKRSLPATFSVEHQAFALEYWNGCCAVCGRPFVDLFNERTLALDHWIPLSSDDCPGTIPTNMIPLCHGIDGCNNSKHNVPPREWLERRYGKRKAKAILARIEAYFEAVRERFGEDDVA